MSSPPQSLLIGWLITQGIIILACIGVQVWTLSEVVRWLHRCYMHSDVCTARARSWYWSSVRAKAGLLIGQFLSVTASLTLAKIYMTGNWGSTITTLIWIAFVPTAMSILMAYATVENAAAARRLNKGT